ncbi:MAG: hypothetical protein M3Q08_02985 [Pseudomonadota bacterium]|nr:hypothetical protein [Pseudomonadota bacterium]
MIIRAIDKPAATLLTMDVAPPAGVRGTFGKIDVLQLTSTELREGFGISLAELDVVTPFELAAALTSWAGRPTAAQIRKNRLVRLIDGRKFLLPCFVGYQEVPGAGMLPFMSDGPPGKWSLFFEEDGRMTLVEAHDDHLAVTPDNDLVGPMTAVAAGPVATAKSYLFGGFGAGRKSKAQAADGDRRVIKINARGDSWDSDQR